MQLRIGILGGSFDPIHNGHMFLADYLYEELKLDKVILVPSGNSYHKGTTVESTTNRLAMVSAATKGAHHLEVSLADVNRDGPTYTVDTIRHFREYSPKGTRLMFFIGADNAQNVTTWKNYKTLLRMVKIVALSRPMARRPFLVHEGEVSVHDCDANTIKFPYVNAPSLNISSSEIRDALKKRRMSVRHKLPPGVFEHITERRLYGW